MVWGVTVVTALQNLTFVVCAKLLSGNVFVAWKLFQKQCTFGNHSEAIKKKVRFFEFSVS